jgi:hypothetical protein
MWSIASFTFARLSAKPTSGRTAQRHDPHQSGDFAEESGKKRREIRELSSWPEIENVACHYISHPANYKKPPVQPTRMQRGITRFEEICAVENAANERDRKLKVCCSKKSILNG